MRPPRRSCRALRLVQRAPKRDLSRPSLPQPSLLRPSLLSLVPLLSLLQHLHTHDAAMTTLFQAYEEEYRDGVRTIRDESEALRHSCDRKAARYKAPPVTGPGSRVQRGAHLTTVLAQVRELVNSMEYEANDLPAAHRQTAKERIAEYRTNLRTLEEGIARLKADASAADRLDLLGDIERKTTSASGADEATAPGALDDVTKAHRMVMLDNTAKFKDAAGKLLQAERLLNDTETVGNEALTSLRYQTETMQHIQETTIVVDEEVSDARRIISGMQKVMIKHKLILTAIIIVLLFLILVAIYVSVTKNHRNSSSTSSEATGEPITSVAPSLSWLSSKLKQ
ncbi:putative Qb-SNARE protein [Leishmania major strain Friedlin]|uniref:Putative Qb-SNARE protein n=1 Tax=Leishmania major TaxID=5664 RepID=Q4QAZ8_LEIMA|nr:putative Qb-SNARE protein [Leishmania major strain Friedlin]CAJ05003.1 putative Qb-SNARE protein [Leishmania major strain Friedlin]|eukprot:XP_001683500.1 putative Qb-SNARE protein [Leishmania major strain Friedlin]